MNVPQTVKINANRANKNTKAYNFDTSINLNLAFNDSAREINMVPNEINNK